MRLLLFGSYPEFGKPLVGGVMAVVRALAQGLAADESWSVAVASAQIGGQPATEQDGRVTVHRLPIPARTRLDWHRRLRRSLLAVAEVFQPDLVHAHVTNFNGAAALDGCWPCLLTVHGVVRHEAALSGAAGLKVRATWQYDTLFEASVMRRARHCVAISPFVRQAFPGHRQIIWYDIPNPILDDCFDVRPQPQPGRLLSPSRVIPRKGIDILIAAFAQVSADFPHAQLRIAGGTADESAYAAQCAAAAAGLQERVHFLGNLSHTALLDEYAHAQAVVLAARQETAPIAISEALAAGVPVLATAVGGVPDQIEPERTGLLVPPEDPDALAVAFRRLLTDPAQASAWGQAGRVAAGRYRLGAVLAQTRAAYQAIIDAAIAHPNLQSPIAKRQT